MWDKLGLGLLAAGGASALTYIGARTIGHRISSAHRGKWTLDDGDLPRDFSTMERLERLKPDEDLLRFWSAKGIPTHTGIRNLSNNRVIMAMLYLRTNVQEVNAFIMGLKRSGRTGSEHKLHPRADYDFDLTSWTTILHIFGDDPELLYPATIKHITSEMMAPDRKRSSIYVPWSFGTFLETENHVLMTEGSYYLCSKWMEDRNLLHGTSHPSSREREAFLSSYLGSILHKGFYEFNSLPYSSYTTHALLNLEAFASDPIRSKSREVLDRTFHDYRIGSLGNRRFPPFRRRTDMSGVTSLLADGLRHYMIAWKGAHIIEKDDPSHALVGSLLPYRPTIWSELCPLSKGQTTYLIGHGPGSSPEIYSRGNGYLITAGGVHRGPISRLINRPTTLLIEDGAEDLSEVVHLGGPGSDQRSSNNTGVVRNIAVGPGPVIVPEAWKGEKNGIWTKYDRSDLTILVHSQDRFGIFCVISDIGSIAGLVGSNHDDVLLTRTFKWSDGSSITYDTGSQRNRWSILTMDGTRMDRRFDLWPKLRAIRW